MGNDDGRPEIVLRDAGVGDIEAIAARHAESWRSAYTGLVRDDFFGPAPHERRLQAGAGWASGRGCCGPPATGRA
jgi:hypothetical protein